MRAKFTRPEILVFVFPLTVYVLTLHSNEYGPLLNIVAVQLSMWKYHTFSIGPLNSLIGSGVLNPDIFPYHGNYFDIYAPGLTLLSFPFAVAGFLLDGGVLKADGYAVLFDEFFVALCAAFASLLVYRICRWYVPVNQSLLAAFVLAFGTSVWPFATVTYNHDVSLVFALASVYFAMRYMREMESISTLILSGICLGVSSLVDYVSVLFVIPLLAYLFYACRRKNKKILEYITTFVVFAAPFLLVASINLLYNYSIFGNFWTFTPQYWIYAPKPPQSGLLGVLERFSLSGLLTHGMSNLISPYRGILLLAPVLIFGFYGIYNVVRLREFRADGILFLSFFLANFLPYSAWRVWDAGNTYGPRFLIYGLPYLVIPIGFVLYQKRRDVFKALFVTLFAFSCIVQGAGAFTYAYQPAANSIFVYLPLSFTFPELMNFDLGVWWFQSGLITNQLIGGSIVVAVFIVIFVFTLSIFKRDPSVAISKVVVPPTISRPETL